MSEVRRMMDTIIEEINADMECGVARFLQSNPYTHLPFYTYDNSITPDLFEKSLYCESNDSERYKNYLCKLFDRSLGKNTFFLVGYQGCGKTTFIHSVFNKYKALSKMQLLLIDCDKRGVGNSFERLKKIFVSTLHSQIDSAENYHNFIDFFEDNFNVIKSFVNGKVLVEFYTFIRELNGLTVNHSTSITNKKIKEYLDISKYIEKLELQELFYLIVLWKISNSYDNSSCFDEKLFIVVDNLDYVDFYDDLVAFINVIDSFTIDFSNSFAKLKLYKNTNNFYSYTDKMKLLIVMRETTKANLPTSHFSDVFKSIYRSYDMTEWYDKSKIIAKRFSELKKYDNSNDLEKEIENQFELLLKITDDNYTKNVIYPLFNNNYRSTINMLSKVVSENISDFRNYQDIMNIKDRTFRHGARGVLFKLIFDEFNKNDGSEESCFRKIGVLDLLNRKNNEVSICRLLLSYLSNYTETKCDSARNCVKLSEILEAFSCCFKSEDILKTLCAMFELRDTHWTHLVSFNQIGYIAQNNARNNLGKIDFKDLDPEKTMIHYSCAGKIYIEYITTHFEFFTARIFKDKEKALFCNENLIFDKTTKKYKFINIIDTVYNEVKQCCDSLRTFNINLCTANNYPNPYDDSGLYKQSHYICQFKRKNYDFEDERRFKKFHEDRMINSHIVYIDKFRLYILNHTNVISDDKKTEINKEIIECIKNYVNLLKKTTTLVSEQSKYVLIPHYEERIGFLLENLNDFDTEISYNE